MQVSRVSASSKHGMTTESSIASAPGADKLRNSVLDSDTTANLIGYFPAQRKERVFVQVFISRVSGIAKTFRRCLNAHGAKISACAFHDSSLVEKPVLYFAA